MTKRAIAILLLITIIIITECAAKANVEVVQKYADPTAESLPIAINNANYNIFQRILFNNEKSLPETKFSPLLEQTNGNTEKHSLVSKRFDKAYKIDEFINVAYKAKLAKETNFITVRVVFINVNRHIKLQVYGSIHRN